jgi:hypothetical protein
MPTTEETLEAMQCEIQPLLETAMEGVLTRARSVLEDAKQQRTQDIAEVNEQRTKGHAEVAEERAKGLAEVDARRAELRREVTAMQMHQASHEGRVELNISGYRFETSVQTLRRVPHNFFDAYFSGRYAQDVCTDGSIFVDRDSEHFGHILEYMRDGVVSVAEPGACPSISLLRALKHEFGFYCIELCAEQQIHPRQQEIALVMGGYRDGRTLARVERYDLSSAVDFNGCDGRYALSFWCMRVGGRALRHWWHLLCRDFVKCGEVHAFERHMERHDPFAFCKMPPRCGCRGFSNLRARRINASWWINFRERF